MEELDKEFDVAFKKYGGIYDLTSYDEKTYFKSIILNCRQHITRFQSSLVNPPYIHLGIINNTSFNAVAAKFESKYFIGINLGTILTLDSIFNRMLSNPEILKEYGNSCDEKIYEKVFTTQIPDFEALYNITGNAPVPKDATRRLLVSHFTIGALLFLTGHEYGHIASGHIDYKESLGFRSVIKELNNMGDRNWDLDPSLSQTLEMDADCTGLVYCYRNAIVLVSNINICPPLFRLFYSDVSTALSLMFFPVYTLWRIFGMFEGDADKLGISTHPSPATRQYISFLLLATLISTPTETPNVTDLEGLEVFKSLMNTMKDVEHAFSIISEQPFIEVVSMFTPEIKAHAKFLQRNWDEVRSLIEPFAIVPLAPYDRDYENINN